MTMFVCNSTDPQPEWKWLNLCTDSTLNLPLPFLPTQPISSYSQPFFLFLVTMLFAALMTNFSCIITD